MGLRPLYIFYSFCHDVLRKTHIRPNALSYVDDTQSNITAQLYVTNFRSGFTLALFKVCLGELNKPVYSEVRTDQRQNNK